MPNLNIAIVQNNIFSSNLQANTQNFIEKLKQIQNTSLVLSPELALCGKNPKDLLLSDDFIKNHENYVREVVKISENLNFKILLGVLLKKDGKLFNAMVLIENGAILQTFYKQEFEKNSLFDENKYFSIKESNNTLELDGKKIALVLSSSPLSIQNNDVKTADLVLFVSSIAYEKNKDYKKELQKQSLNIGKNILHVNSLAYENGIVFAGDVSLHEGSKTKEFNKYFNQNIITLKTEVNQTQSQEEEIYNAICFGFTNFIKQNGFTKAVFGLSGGVDSAICATIACDCLGAENVYTYMLASRYTSSSSLEDAKTTADNLGCSYKVVSIQNIVEENIKEISTNEPDIALSPLALENIQSRIRANILMAICNSLQGSVLIATGNKSEIATGFCTLYGDTCGALAPIGDILKTDLYKIVKWRNENVPKNSLLQKNNVIAQNILVKAPSAELNTNQKDEDRLPKYTKLDKVIKLLIEDSLNYEEILKEIDKETLDEAISLITHNEFKRKLLPSAIKISKKSFLPNEWSFGLLKNTNITGR